MIRKRERIENLNEGMFGVFKKERKNNEREKKIIHFVY